MRNKVDFFRVFLLGIISFFFLVTSVFSQTVNLGKIVIQPNKINTSKTKFIDNSNKISSFAEYPNFSPFELLNYFSSIVNYTRQYSGIQHDILLQGNSFQGTQIELQGLNFTHPLTGHYNLDLPLTNQDLQYIQIQPEENKIKFSLKPVNKDKSFFMVATGNWGFCQESFSFSRKMKFYPLNWRGNFAHKKAKGDRTDTDFESFKINLFLHSSDQKNKFFLGITKKTFGADSFYSQKFPQEEEHTQNVIGWMEFKRSFQPLLKINTKIYLQKFRDHFLLNRKKPSYFAATHKVSLIGLKQKFIFSHLSHFWVEFDLRRENLKSTTLNKHTRYSQSILLRISSIPLSFIPAKLDLEEGIKIFEKKYHYFHKINLTYPVTNSAIIYLNQAIFFRTPSFIELYLNSPANQGNKNLKHPCIQKILVGYQNFFKNGWFKNELFFQKTHAGIDWLKQKNGSWLASNISYIIKGYNFNLSSQLSSCITFNLDYTYLFKKQKNNLTNPLKYFYYYPRHKLVVNLSFNKGNWHFSLVPIITKFYHHNFDLTLNLKLERKFINTTVFVEAINLFNEDKYESSFKKQARAWIKVGWRYEF